MPPATAASKAIVTPLACALANNSLPCKAIKALLAVITCLPFSIAARTNSRAIPVPPINSTTTWISGSLTISNASVVSLMPLVSQSRFLSIVRSAARVISISLPARRVISLMFRLNTFTVPLPTVPKPSTPIFTDCTILPLSLF